jgi:hypothetical protein
MKLKATIQVEFEALPGQPDNALESALRRGIGELTKGIEHGVPGFGATGIIKGSTRIDIIDKKIS